MIGMTEESAPGRRDSNDSLKLDRDTASVSCPRHRRGRPSSGEESSTYNDILSAARYEFSRQGFDKVTLRAIARRAGCDPKLIHYYFGGKDELFTKAAQQIIGDSHLLDFLIKQDARRRSAAERSLGASLIKALLNFMESTELGEAYLSLVRNAGQDDHVRALMIGMVRGELQSGRLKAIKTDKIEKRMVLVGSQMLGLIMVRDIFRVEPLASMPVGTVARIIGPTIDRYLYADLSL